MNDNQGKKGQKPASATNVMETLKNVGDSLAPAGGEIKDIAKSTVNSIKEDLIKGAPQSIMEQLLGIPQSRSGEIYAGETLEIKDVMTGKRGEEERFRKQIMFERRLHQEEKIRIERKSNELRMQLRALMKEVVVLAESTQSLGEQTKIASLQAPVEPGLYHIIFFEKLLEFIKSFRKKIEEASVWLHASNNRAQKKNYWARYKKHGAKFLLSGEHYLTRSAG